jgi:hypothetical protein
MNKLLFLLMLLPSFAPAQERQLLRGKAITDELKIESLSVYNISGETSTESNGEGDFSIYAKEADTLMFSSIGFNELRVILTAKDLKEELFVVRLESGVTMLDEVVVNKLTGSLAADSKNIKTLTINSLFDPADINKDIIIETGIGGVNFIAVFNMVFKKKKAPVKASVYQTFMPPPHKLFADVVRGSFPEKFFTESLKIPIEKVPLFLQFCDDGSKRYLLDPRNEFQLIEYLNAKSHEYLKQQETGKK